MKGILLKPGRERSVLHRHPWVFSGALQESGTILEDGETVRLVNSKGDFLAWGAYSGRSNIRVRIWSWDPDEIIDDKFFRVRLQKAIQARQSFISTQETNALRLVHGESDWLPGLIVDRYAKTLVVQFLSCGAEYWREIIVGILSEITGAEQIFERSEISVRELEGLPERAGLLIGSSPPDFLEIHENGLRFLVDIVNGQKTGFYIDQRQNRSRVRQLASGKKVLDCFSYTGGFAVYALAGGASSILAVESSVESIALGIRNLELNGFSTTKFAWQEGDVFKVLRSLRDRAEYFDMIILDPPKYAPTSSHIQKAARAYKDINLLAFKLLNPGGLLFTFSCSGGINLELFQKIVAGAAYDAGVQAQVLDRMYQSPDHPVSLYFPEGAYLKGLVIRIQ